jgi:starch-binding outer membrane protein, SusD/RagB family
MMWADQLDYGIERINREYVIGMISRLSLMRGGYWLYPDMQMRRKEDYRKYYEIANTYAKKLVNLKPRELGDFNL